MRRLINDKRGVKFENILIAFIIFSLFIACGTLMIADLNSIYEDSGVNISTENFSEVYDATEDIFQISKNVDDKVLRGDVTEGSAEDATIKGAYSTLRLMGNTYSLFKGVTTAIQKTTGIPPIIMDAAFTGFSLIILFSIVYLVFRFIPK